MRKVAYKRSIQLSKAFKINSFKKGVTHWNEKMLHLLTGKDLVERFSVIIGSKEFKYLLSVSKLIAGTEEPAKYLYNLLIK